MSHNFSGWYILFSDGQTASYLYEDDARRAAIQAVMRDGAMAACVLKRTIVVERSYQTDEPKVTTS